MFRPVVMCRFDEIAFWPRVLILVLVFGFMPLARAVSLDSGQIGQTIRDGALLVDVRSRGEFARGHLAGAINIPLDTIATNMGRLGTDRHRPILLYCVSGFRSGKAEKALRHQGFTQVLNVGGFGDLKAMRLPKACDSRQWDDCKP
jgi:rhodanese-related sulfurtransferase